MSLIKNLLQNKSQDQTVFTVTEVSQVLNISNKDQLYSALKYATQKGDILRITRGIYALDSNYSRLELGNKLRKPSYISLYSTLQDGGIVFQPYSSIYLISNRSETVEIDRQKYIYRKLKDEILLNSLGLIEEKSTIKATPERSLCDKVYLDGDEHFDNLRTIDWDLMEKLNHKIYGNNEGIVSFISKYKNASS